LLAQKDLAEQYKKIEEDQKKQGQEGGKAADGITEQYSKNIVQQQKLNAKMEDVVFKGIDNALVITNKLGDATDTLATGFEVLGKAVNKLLNIFGLGVKEPKVPTAPTKEQEAASAAVTKARSESEAADKKLLDQMDATEALKKSLADIAKTNDKSAETTAKIADLKKQIAASEQQELVLNKEAKIAASKKLEASAAQANANRAARGQASTATATPTAKSGKQELPAGVAPSAAGGGRGSAAPPAGSPPSSGPATRSLTPPPPSAGAPDGQPGQPTPAGQTQGGGKGSLKIGPNADMSGLDAEMISRLQKFAESTGKSVDVNSAFRSDQKQAELWVRGHILNEPGVHMPAAPKDDQEVNYKGKTFQVKGSGKGSLHGVGNAVDISVAGMGKSKGPIDELLANAGLFRPFIAKDHPHVQMMAEGGIIEPTPGGTPAIIGEGGNAEAVIPLKNGAVPVRLFGDSFKSKSDSAPVMLDMDSLFQNMTASMKSTLDMDSLFQNMTASMKNADPGTMDMESLYRNMNSTMFAAVETLKADAIDSGFDRDMRQEVIEPVEADNETATEVFDTAVASEPTGIIEFLKEAKEANFAMLSMISELVREQRNANDISTRILQVSSN
jgi:hypothetical protein